MGQLDDVMRIWLETNIEAHPFVAKEQWQRLYGGVKAALPSADVYVSVDNGGQVNGFIGVADRRYVAGLFVAGPSRSQGIGQALLAHCQRLHSLLELDVFVENTGATRFYQRNGFVIHEQKMNPVFSRQEYHMFWTKDKSGSDFT